MLSLFGAMTINRVIGKQNQLPWRLPVDLAYFKAVTLGHTVVMGRKTYQSIGKPLPGRTNIVLSTDPDFHPVDCLVLRSSTAVLDLDREEEVFIIGGAQVFQQFMLYAHRIYLTLIAAKLQGDAYFPKIDPAIWRLVSRRCFAKDEDNEFDGFFLIFERRSG